MKSSEKWNCLFIYICFNFLSKWANFHKAFLSQDVPSWFAVCQRYCAEGKFHGKEKKDKISRRGAMWSDLFYVYRKVTAALFPHCCRSVYVTEGASALLFGSTQQRLWIASVMMYEILNEYKFMTWPPLCLTSNNPTKAAPPPGWRSLMSSHRTAKLFCSHLVTARRFTKFSQVKWFIDIRNLLKSFMGISYKTNPGCRGFYQNGKHY